MPPMLTKRPQVSWMKRADRTEPTEPAKRVRLTALSCQSELPRMKVRVLLRSKMLEQRTQRIRLQMVGWARTAMLLVWRTTERRAMLLTMAILKAKMAPLTMVRSLTKVASLMRVKRWGRKMGTWSKLLTARMGMMVTPMRRKPGLALQTTRLPGKKPKMASSLQRRRRKCCWLTLSTTRWTPQNSRKSSLPASFRTPWRRSKDLLVLIFGRSTTSRCWIVAGSFMLSVTRFACTTSRPGSSVSCMGAKMAASDMLPLMPPGLGLQLPR
mmetsp:Transcript_60076/g.161048  ORF Transcript_60076/g.161048 Transcript_60076/m.161048 type:complete len:269 (-) Transcript_60076:5186-5992(-)